MLGNFEGFERQESIDTIQVYDLEKVDTVKFIDVVLRTT
jgi:hypothetical protein